MKTSPSQVQRLASTFILALTMTQGSATAGELSSDTISQEVDTFEEIWSLATLYGNEGNPILKKFAISGRFHADYSHLESNQGDYSDFDARRLRIGFKSQWFQDFTLHVEADLDAENVDFDFDSESYKGLTDAYLGWSPNKQ